MSFYPDFSLFFNPNKTSPTLVGGLIRGVEQPLAKAGETVAEGANAAVDLVRNIPNIVQGKSVPPYQSQYISPDEEKQLTGTFGQATVEGARTGAQAASTLLPSGPNLGAKALTGGARGLMYGSGIGSEFDLPTTLASGAAGAVLEPLVSLLASGKLTQKQINNQMAKVKTASVKKGDSMTYDDFRRAVNDKVEEVDPNDVNPELRTEVKNLLIKKSPPLTGTTDTGLKQPEVNANWLHSMRMQMDKELGPQYWNSNQSNPISSQAKEVIRHVAGEQLHFMAPETEALDQINSIYYSPLVKGLKLGPFSAQYPESMTGVPSVAANVLAALLGITGAKKLLGK